MGGPRPPLRQSLTHQPSAFLSQADATVPNIKQQPSVLDSVFHRHKQRRLVADSLPPCHGSPVSELIEFSAQQEGQVISRCTLPHSATPKGKMGLSVLLGALHVTVPAAQCRLSISEHRRLPVIWCARPIRSRPTGVAFGRALLCAAGFCTGPGRCAPIRI